MGSGRSIQGGGKGMHSVESTLFAQSEIVLWLLGLGLDTQGLPFWSFVLRARLGAVWQASHHTGTESSLLASTEVR